MKKNYGQTVLLLFFIAAVGFVVIKNKDEWKAGDKKHQQKGLPIIFFHVLISLKRISFCRKEVANFTSCLVLFATSYI